MPHSLFEDFRESGFHSSILSTFSVDPAFYDASLQLRLRGAGCQNNILLADARMLEQSLDAIPDAFANAGRKYLVAPVATGSCFHPKLALRYGKAKARLVVGSANVTAAGWAGNLELVSTLSWHERDDGPDARVHRTLLVRAHLWLSRLIGAGGDSKAVYKLELMRSQSPWLDSDGLAETGPFPLSDGSTIDLLLSDPNDANGLAHRMLGLVDEPIERLTVISPYWDRKLSALKHLWTAVTGPEIHVFLSLNPSNPSRSSTFPVGAIGTLPVTFHPIGEKGAPNARFLHAKMFLFRGERHDFLFMGSANCTVAALGTPGAAGTNHECLLFRKLPRGMTRKHLGLSYKTLIAATDITVPPSPTNPAPKAADFAPGSIERRERWYVWTPASPVAEACASVEIGDILIPLARRADGLWSGEIGDPIVRSNIARIRLTDGRISRPTIIADPDELMRFAPFPVADALRKKLDAILDGDAGLIDLARDIHLLLEDDVRTRPSRERIRAANGRTALAGVAGRDFATANEFRAALNLTASLTSVGLGHGDSPVLQSMLQIVLRGLVDVHTIDRIDAEDIAHANSHLVGEDQDDVGSDGLPGTTPSASCGIAEPQCLSVSAFERNQTALRKGIQKFQSFLEHAKETDGALDLNFVTRSLFMLYLMLHGCTKRYRVEDGAEAVLLPFGDDADDDFRESFLFVATRAVAAIWGPDFTRSLISRLAFTVEGHILPIQITTLAIVSRWVLAAILAEVRTVTAHKSLSTILNKQVPTLFKATTIFPALSCEEMVTTIRQMEANIGIDPDQAARIRLCLDELGSDLASTTSAPTTG